MATCEPALVARARHAYEGGRLTSAAVRTLALVPLPAVALGCGCQPRTVVIAGSIFLAAVGFCFWRGGDWRRGAIPGIAAGLVPLLTPAALQAGAHACRVDHCGLMTIACAAGGLLGGVLLAWLAPAPRSSGGLPFVVACVVAGLAGAIGCLAYGAIGLAVMTAGLAAGSLPALALRKV
ncbi:MAG TPA: hypothetical protein VFD06_08260 [Candidatus Polarisedimenticolia bacterium]|nr:hypothetical protein [Candidatus Polarisedimenticolia bacterium]